MSKEKNGKKLTEISFEELGDNHIGTSSETPLRPDAFERDDELKIDLIEKHFREILEILGLNLDDDSLNGTPRRVAKMYVKEIFKGLDPKGKPNLSLFENKYHYNQMLVEKDITLHTQCEHHLLPIEGKVHIAYISKGYIIGLSKINRIVEYFSRRPQVQERLTMQIANFLQKVLQTPDVAVILDAYHMCVTSRGVKDSNTRTITSEYSGKFREESYKKEFWKYLQLKTHQEE